MTVNWPESFLNWPVGIYILIVVGAQVLLQVGLWFWHKRTARRRSQAGLPSDIIMDHPQPLSRVRWESGLQAGVLLFSVFVVPLLMVLFNVIGWFRFRPEEQVKGGLLAVFLAILIWLLLQGTDVVKAFLGGLAFKILVTFQHSIQVGDRVTLKGHGGKVVKIGTFFVTLQTPDDDIVNIPSKQLWSEVLVSANAGERSSLCVMEFDLTPFVTKSQRQAAENAIWDSMQASPYCETAKPMQIYLSQKPSSICLTAKAYVISTYDELLFKSDVTRAFLDFAADKGIPLAYSQWKLARNERKARPAPIANGD